jgi:hypothetical protein
VPPVGEDDRYRPQPQQPPAQPQANPYQQPAPQQQEYVPQQSQQEYAPQQPDPYYSGAGAAQAAYGPPPPGYDYDPYAMRDEEGNNTMQWFLIGCLGLVLLCCCMTVVLAVAIDTFCLYDQIPGLMRIINAFDSNLVCTLN